MFRFVINKFHLSIQALKHRRLGSDFTNSSRGPKQGTCVFSHPSPAHKILGLQGKELALLNAKNVPTIMQPAAAASVSYFNKTSNNHGSTRFSW